MYWLHAVRAGLLLRYVIDRLHVPEEHCHLVLVDGIYIPRAERSEKKLATILAALREDLRARIKSAGATSEGGGGGPSVRMSGSGGPKRVLRTSEFFCYERLGYRGDVFLVAFPAVEKHLDYVVILRVVEML